MLIDGLGPLELLVSVCWVVGRFSCWTETQNPWDLGPQITVKWPSSWTNIIFQFTSQVLPREWSKKSQNHNFQLEFSRCVETRLKLFIRRRVEPFWVVFLLLATLARINRPKIKWVNLLHHCQIKTRVVSLYFLRYSRALPKETMITVV